MSILSDNVYTWHAAYFLFYPSHPRNQNTQNTNRQTPPHSSFIPLSTFFLSHNKAARSDVSQLPSDWSLRLTKRTQGLFSWRFTPSGLLAKGVAYTLETESKGRRSEWTANDASIVKENRWDLLLLCFVCEFRGCDSCWRTSRAVVHHHHAISKSAEQSTSWCCVASRVPQQITITKRAQTSISSWESFRKTYDKNIIGRTDSFTFTSPQYPEASGNHQIATSSQAAIIALIWQNTILESSLLSDYGRLWPSCGVDILVQEFLCVKIGLR